jgi:hypothetical protein
VGRRTDVDGVEMRKFLPLPGLEFLPLGRPACIQSLSRFSNTAHVSDVAYKLGVPPMLELTLMGFPS